MRKIALFHFFTLLLGIFSIAYCQKTGWEEIFFKASQDYQEGRFEDAKKRYQLLIKSGKQNGYLYYNMANTCYRLGQLGKAILYYENARFLIPRNADLNANLAYARGQVQDEIDDPSSFFKLAFFWLDSLNLIELFWSFVVLNLVFWAILLKRIFSRSEWSYYLFLIIFIIWGIIGSSFGLKYFELMTDDRAVILKKEVDVLAGPNSNDTLLFRLHEGSIVHLDRREGGWSLIRLPKKRGWVESNSIAIIKGHLPDGKTTNYDFQMPLNINKQR